MLDIPFSAGHYVNEGEEPGRHLTLFGVLAKKKLTILLRDHYPLATVDYVESTTNKSQIKGKKNFDKRIESISSSRACK